MIAAKKTSHTKRTQQNQHSDISKLLDKLLENYVNHKKKIIILKYVSNQVFSLLKLHKIFRIIV